MLVWFACLQAMRDWPRIDPDQARCPTMLLVGTENRGVVQWVEANHDPLDQAGIRVEMAEGLNHAQEFTQIAPVFPVASSVLVDAAS